MQSSSAKPRFNDAALRSKLANWVGHDLLTEEQAQAILAHETSHGDGTGATERPWALYGVVGVGLTALLTGVVSLVAANWVAIPDWTKLTTYFVIQSGIGWLFLRHSRTPGVLREAALSAYALFLFVGIGLVAQVFHLAGEGWPALLLWLVITFPLVHFSEGRLIAHTWVVTSFVAASIWAVSGPDHPVQGLGVFARTCFLCSLPFWQLAIAEWGERFPDWYRELRKALRIWNGLLLLGVGTPLASILWFNDHRMTPDLEFIAVPWAALLAACGATAAHPHLPRPLRIYRILLYLTLGVFCSLPFVFTSIEYENTGTKVVAALGFFLMWSLAAAYATAAKRKRWFDIASLVLALRVIEIYFEVFGTLATTGIGLIVSGLVILAIAFAWQRLRGRVQLSLERNQ